jgi:hypothetical protein
MRAGNVPNRVHSGEMQMFEDLKFELTMALYMVVRTLVFVLVHVVWFALLIFAFPYLFKWFLWPLV